MGDKITHRQHKWILTVLISLTIVFGIAFARFIIGREPDYDVIITLMFGMIFTLCLLVIIALGVIVRMDEDFFWHHKKL
ncbi:MAG: hypothetical protein KKG59_03475 [Nanoarchaeota archaeon]|nr:hypothetical protein [Nanoarchaeota archaeon]